MGKGHHPKGGGAWQGQHQHKAWYDSVTWKRLREVVLQKHPLCGRCRERNRLVPATTVNHRVPHRGDWSLFNDIHNLEAVCASCHSGEIQQQEVRGYSSRVGEDGWPTDANHPFNKR